MTTYYLNQIQGYLGWVKYGFNEQASVTPTVNSLPEKI